MTEPVKSTLPATEVLHSENHSHLSAEEIAKAVARHNREHKSGAKAPAPNPTSKPNKAKPSR